MFRAKKKVISFLVFIISELSLLSNVAYRKNNPFFAKLLWNFAAVVSYLTSALGKRGNFYIFPQRI